MRPVPAPPFRHRWRYQRETGGASGVCTSSPQMMWWWSLSSGPLVDGPRLAGRVVLVTGAAGAIGRAVVAAFTAAGAGCQAAGRVPGGGALACDVTDESPGGAGLEATQST